MCKILMPINPEYVDEILMGNKKYEYRKIKAKRRNIDKIDDVRNLQNQVYK